MRSRGWGPCPFLGSYQLIGTRSRDLKRSGRGSDRQTEKWTRGCVRGIKIETSGGTIRTEARDTERDEESNRGGHCWERWRHKEMK